MSSMPFSIMKTIYMVKCMLKFSNKNVWKYTNVKKYTSVHYKRCLRVIDSFCTISKMQNQTVPNYQNEPLGNIGYLAPLY